MTDVQLTSLNRLSVRRSASTNVSMSLELWRAIRNGTMREIRRRKPDIRNNDGFLEVTMKLIARIASINIWMSIRARNALKQSFRAAILSRISDFSSANASRSMYRLDCSDVTMERPRCSRSQTASRYINIGKIVRIIRYVYPT